MGLGFILGILAVIFGVIGFNKKLYGLAITGFFFGLLEVVFTGFI